MNKLKYGDEIGEFLMKNVKQITNKTKLLNNKK